MVRGVKMVVIKTNKEPEKKYVIVSPHNDDAVIGCWELVARGEVKKIIYINENNEDALNEIKRFCEDFKIELDVCSDVGNVFKIVPLALIDNCIILVPSNNDHHPEHKLCSSLQYIIGRDYIGLYSIDMNEQWVRETGNPKEKEEILNKYFPSKKDLWEYDKKYILFEGKVVLI